MAETDIGAATEAENRRSQRAVDGVLSGTVGPVRTFENPETGNRFEHREVGGLLSEVSGARREFVEPQVTAVSRADPVGGRTRDQDCRSVESTAGIVGAMAVVGAHLDLVGPGPVDKRPDDRGHRT